MPTHAYTTKLWLILPSPDKNRYLNKYNKHKNGYIPTDRRLSASHRNPHLTPQNPINSQCDWDLLQNARNLCRSVRLQIYRCVLGVEGFVFVRHEVCVHWCDSLHLLPVYTSETFYTQL